jgi:hypothetical protein
VGAHFLLTERRRLVGFALGGLPVAIALFGYAQSTFGSPLAFGQLSTGTDLALIKTGKAELWQTPLWLGMAGLLVSPSRGLFVYTPLALFAVWGAARAFRMQVWGSLRPLAVAAVAMVILTAKWFDWWGGWSFGYRTIVDIAILLGFLALPVAQAIGSNLGLRAAFAALLFYSIAVQALGAFVYDVTGWNGRKGWEAMAPGMREPVAFVDRASAVRFARERGGRWRSTTMNIDDPRYRGRLWSVADSPLVYYLAHLSSARNNRRKVIERFLRNNG